MSALVLPQLITFLHNQTESTYHFRSWMLSSTFVFLQRTSECTVCSYNVVLLDAHCCVQCHVLIADSYVALLLTPHLLAADVCCCKVSTMRGRSAGLPQSG